MRTPFGAECPYFYGNYFRGRHEEECRLIGNHPPPQNWKPELCKACPVPSIKRANACENMQLNATIKRSLGLFRRDVSVNAYCKLVKSNVAEPHIGCGSCHSISFFEQD